MKLGKYDWIPNVGVGEFKFGEPVSQYVESGVLIINRFMEELVGMSYDDAEGTINVCEENGMIEDIYCDKILTYRNQNLIGLHIDDAAMLLERKPSYGEPLDKSEIFDDGRLEVPAEFDDLGLTLWLDEGIVVSAAASYDLLEED